MQQLMAAISVRGPDDAQLRNLKAQARRQGVSLHRLVLQRLSGQDGPVERAHDDLEALAGTWSAQDAEEFEAAIAPLERVDPELWT